MGFIRKLEVKPIIRLLDVQGLRVGVIFHDDLFQKQESSLMADFLPELNCCSPQMRGVSLSTVGTLSVVNYILSHKALL
jgi:hypothetical protein